MAGKLSIMQLIIIQFLACLGWLSVISLAQLEFSETVTRSVYLTDLGITCLINTAVFVTSFLRGRLFMEMGARDAMAACRGQDKLKEIINGSGLTIDVEGYSGYTSVLMLSNDLSNSSMRLFMQYMYSTHDVYSILLKCVSPPSIDDVGHCNCGRRCNCIVFWANEQIAKMLATRFPGTLKQLCDSKCLLPCHHCLEIGCHGCNPDPKVESSAVCETVHGLQCKEDNQEEPSCICIPLNPPNRDEWTKALVKSLNSRDVAERGAAVMPSVVLENYLSMSGENQEARYRYRTMPFIMPRLIEILINLVLTGWLKLDGFSSAMVARKAVRNHIVDSKGNGFAANAFLTAIRVKFIARKNTTLCLQKLSFRGGTFLTLKTLSLIVGSVNLICSLGWAVLIAFGGSAGKWYEITSMPLSIPRLAVVMAAICITLVMDCFDFFSIKLDRMRMTGSVMLLVMILEMAYIVSGTVVAGTLGIKGIGRWVYSALQILVWVKWGVGCYLLGEYSPEYHDHVDRLRISWFEVGGMMYSSSFLLNAVLAGVRGWM